MGPPFRLPLLWYLLLLPCLPPSHSVLSSTLDRESVVPHSLAQAWTKEHCSSQQQSRLEFSKGTWLKTKVSKENTKSLNIVKLTKDRFPILQLLHSAGLSDVVPMPSLRILFREILCQIFHKPSLHTFLCLPSLLKGGFERHSNWIMVIYTWIKKNCTFSAFESDRPVWFYISCFTSLSLISSHLHDTLLVELYSAHINACIW